MHVITEQQPLFELECTDECTHCFYAATNSVTLKIGQSRDVAKRMKNAQFRGFQLIKQMPCPCDLRRIGGKMICEREISWAQAFAADRLPNSEQFRWSADLDRALRFFCGKDKKAIAITDWFRQHGATRVA